MAQAESLESNDTENTETSEQSGENTRSDCPVCGRESRSTCYGCGWVTEPNSTDRGLERTPHPIAPTLWAVFRAGDWTPSSGVLNDPPVVSALRKFDTIPQNRLNKAGWQAPNVGLNVTEVRSWQQKRKHIGEQDRQLFDDLLRDAVECTLLFWSANHGYQDPVAFVEDAQAGDIAATSNSESNIVNTLDWLTDDLEAYLSREIPTQALLPVESLLDDGKDASEILIASLSDGLKAGEPIDDIALKTGNNTSERGNTEAGTADEKITSPTEMEPEECKKTEQTATQSELGDW